MTEEVIERILSAHGFRGPWSPLEATGVANHIFATADVVLRVATTHPDAVSDARTESVAAPRARSAGLPVPALLVFDDSRRLTGRPYSIWERIHGDTLGLLAPDSSRTPALWQEVGRQLARLHSIESCADPHGWLDRPARRIQLDRVVAELRLRGAIADDLADEIAEWLEGCRPHVARPTQPRFLHNDIHVMNLMCTADARLLSIIDWGDAGWGDPAMELAQVPPRAIPSFLNGYREAAPEGLAEEPMEPRIVWDQLDAILEAWNAQESPERIAELRRFVRATEHLWRD